MQPLRERLGRAIRELRVEAGMSQEGFAHHIGVHRTYAGTLERGKTNPTLTVLEKVAAGLGISVSELIRTAESLRLGAGMNLVPEKGGGKRSTDYQSTTKGRPAKVARVAERRDRRR